MNIYVIVEGVVTEKKVYQHWIPLVNPCLSYVDHISKILNNNFSIFTGGGYPQYKTVITNAIIDVNTYGNIDRLVIAIDSEEMSYTQKYNEIHALVSQYSCSAQIVIVIQHFCFETWALGNQSIISRHPQSAKLREYINFYNITTNDPENLPALHKEELNRSQFAKKYLKHALNDRYKNLSYSDNNPRVLLNDKYFTRVKQRVVTNNHINSFRGFLGAFI